MVDPIVDRVDVRDWTEDPLPLHEVFTEGVARDNALFGTLKIYSELYIKA